MILQGSAAIPSDYNDEIKGCPPTPWKIRKRGLILSQKMASRAIPGQPILDTMEE